MATRSQAKGKVQHIGATNFDVARLKEMAEAGATIANNQVHMCVRVCARVVGSACRDAALCGHAGALLT